MDNFIYLVVKSGEFSTYTEYCNNSSSWVKTFSTLQEAREYVNNKIISMTKLCLSIDDIYLTVKNKHNSSTIAFKYNDNTENAFVWSAVYKILKIKSIDTIERL